METDTFIAIVGLIEAFIGLVAVIIERAPAGTRKNLNISPEGSFSRLIVFSILIYAITGLTTAILSGFATYFTGTPAFWATTHVSWAIGNIIIILLVINYAFIRRA